MFMKLATTLDGGALTPSEEWPIERGDNLDDASVLVHGAVAMHGGGQHERHMHELKLGAYVSTLRDTRRWAGRSPQTSSSTRIKCLC
jgi:hypothetical protein